jgi:pyruvate ferredoxin oxidoreductase beta subunit
MGIATPLPEEELFVSGHSCAGCGETLAIRIAMKALGKDTIVCLSSGCHQSFSARYDATSWHVPAIHVLSGNASAVACGVRAAMNRLNKNPNIVVFAGDGATYDFGFSLMKEMLKRNDRIIYVCLDNEGYMNSGVQRSDSTPLGAYTTTTPSPTGNPCKKRDLISIIKALGTPYIATSTVAHPNDIFRKLKNATEVKGASYIQILTPCPTGWGFDSSKTVEVARLALETRMWINFEIVEGRIRDVTQANKKPVEDYLRRQNRFSHLFKSEDGKDIIKRIQEIADRNAKIYGLF